MWHFQTRGRRQNDVCMATGFIDVNVDADHKIQASQRFFHLGSVRCGQYGIAAAGDQSADLPLSGSQHFFGQGGNG